MKDKGKIIIKQKIRLRWSSVSRWGKNEGRRTVGSQLMEKKKSE